MHPPPLQSPFHLHVLFVAFAIWLLPEWIGTFFQRPGRGARRRDRGSHGLLILSLFAGIAAAFFCLGAVPRAAMPVPGALFWAGIATMLAGVAFRWYAIRVLGRFFTRDVATHEGQVVVEKGPYRLIRHPSYTGNLLVVAGIGLALANWASLAVVLAFALAGHAYRVRVEEQALCAALGDAYRDYMKRTRRFIPWVW